MYIKTQGYLILSDGSWLLQYDQGGLKGSGSKKKGSGGPEGDEGGEAGEAVAAPGAQAKGKKPGEDKEETFYDSGG